MLKRKMLTSILLLCFFISFTLIIPMQEAEAFVQIAIGAELAKTTGAILIAGAGYQYTTDEQLRADVNQFLSTASTAVVDEIQNVANQIQAGLVTSYVVSQQIFDAVFNYASTGSAVHDIGFTGDVITNYGNPANDGTNSITIGTAWTDIANYNDSLGVGSGGMWWSPDYSSNSQVRFEIRHLGTGLTGEHIIFRLYSWGTSQTVIRVTEHSNLIGTYTLPHNVVPMFINVLTSGSMIYAFINGSLIASYNANVPVGIATVNGYESTVSNYQFAPTGTASLVQSVPLSIPAGGFPKGQINSKWRTGATIAGLGIGTGLLIDQLTTSTTIDGDPLTGGTSSTPTTWDWSTAWQQLKQWLQDILNALGALTGISTLINKLQELISWLTGDLVVSPTLVKDKIIDKTQLPVLQSTMEKLHSFDTSRGQPPKFEINLNQLVSAGSNIHGKTTGGLPEKSTIVDFAILQDYKFGTHSIIDIFRMLVSFGMIYTTWLYIWRKVTPDQVIGG